MRQVFFKVYEIRTGGEKYLGEATSMRGALAIRDGRKVDKRLRRPREVVIREELRFVQRPVLGGNAK